MFKFLLPTVPEVICDTCSFDNAGMGEKSGCPYFQLEEWLITEFTLVLVIKSPPCAIDSFTDANLRICIVLPRKSF